MSSRRDNILDMPRSGKPNRALVFHVRDENFSDLTCLADEVRYWGQSRLPGFALGLLSLTQRGRHIEASGLAQIKCRFFRASEASTAKAAKRASEAIRTSNNAVTISLIKFR
jgi:hypothetical protein